MKEFDFLPRGFHEAARHRQQRRRNVLYVIALTGALGALHVVNASRLQSAEASLTAINEDGGLRSDRRQRVEALSHLRQTLLQRSELVSRLDDDAPLDVIVAEVGRLMGKRMVIRSLAVETAPADVEKAQDADPLFDRGRLSVHLVGAASSLVDVGILFGRLTESPLFEQVTMSFSREGELAGQQMKEFELNFLVRRVALSGNAE
jgi:hypothetical protein